MVDSWVPGSHLSFETVAECTRHLHAFYANMRHDTIEIDLSAVVHCDSAGLALLLEAKRSAKHYKKQCRLVNVSPKLQALCVFYGLEQVLNDHK